MKYRMTIPFHMRAMCTYEEVVEVEAESEEEALDEYFAGNYEEISKSELEIDDDEVDDPDMEENNIVYEEIIAAWVEDEEEIEESLSPNIKNKDVTRMKNKSLISANAALEALKVVKEELTPITPKVYGSYVKVILHNVNEHWMSIGTIDTDLIDFDSSTQDAGEVALNWSKNVLREKSKGKPLSYMMLGDDSIKFKSDDDKLKFLVTYKRIG